jgi:hypothetical protein
MFEGTLIGAHSWRMIAGLIHVVSRREDLAYKRIGVSRFGCARNTFGWR